MKNFEKKYQLWTYTDSAYTFTEFDTLQECIESPKYTDWYVTKRVQMTVTDVDEFVSVLKAIPRQYVQTDLPPEDRSDEEENSALVAAYSRGPIGNL